MLKLALFAEYVSDTPMHALLNVGGGYLLDRTEQIDFHLAFGLNRNSPDYIIGTGYSYRWDNVLARRRDRGSGIDFRPIVSNVRQADVSAPSIKNT